MGQTLSIAAHAEPGGAPRPGANPGPVPDLRLFALLMAEAGRPFAEGFGAQGAPDADVDAGMPALEGSEGPIDLRGALDLPAEGEAIPGGIPLPERTRPPLNVDAIRPDASGATAFRRAAVSPGTLAAPDEALVAKEIPPDPRPEKGLERGTRSIAGLDVADPEAAADAAAVRNDRPVNPPADLSTTAKPARLSELDLEGFGVKRIEVQVERSNSNSPGETPPRGDSIDRASIRPVDALPGPRGETTPMDGARPALEPSRAPEGGLHMSEVEALEEAPLADHADSGTGESGGGRTRSDHEWNAIAAGRSTRPGPNEIDVQVEAGPDLPDAQPDAARPAGELRAESRESGAIARDRHALAPQPPKLPDPGPRTAEPARRVVMMVGDAESEVQVLVHERNGDVSVRFDAPYAIRAHLEASAHQLIESMSREQVSLTSMTFSGPSHGNDPHSNPRHLTRTGSRGIAGAGSAEDTPTIESGLDFAESGSRVRIRV